VFGGNFTDFTSLSAAPEISTDSPQLGIADVLDLSEGAPIGASGGATEISVADKDSGALATNGQTWQSDLTLLPIDPDSGP
jgi:hypothetical protein